MATEELISIIKSKVQSLAEKKNRLEKENAAMKAKLANFEEQAQLNKTELDQMKERLKIVKMAKTLGEVDEKNTDSKYKISQLVKEIDRCIAMLSS